MKSKNPIEENQKLKDDNDFLKIKYKRVRKENLELRKEIKELKKNLECF